MEHVTVRVPADLLEEIDESLNPEQSRSEWLREAAREKLEQKEERDELRTRVNRLEREIEHQKSRGLLDILLNK